MEVSTELTTGTTLWGTVTVALTGCVEIMIFIVGTGAVIIAMIFVLAGIDCSISIVTNESIIAQTATIIVMAIIVIVNTFTITESFE